MPLAYSEKSVSLPWMNLHTHTQRWLELWRATHAHESVYCISPCAFIREHDVNTFRKSQHTFLFQHCVRPPHMATVTASHGGKP